MPQETRSSSRISVSITTPSRPSKYQPHHQTNEIFAIFGPARSGKTTLLKSLNRLTDLIFGARHTGTILLDGTDIYDPKVSLTQLRRRIGMVFDLPTPLPMSIFDNVAYGPD